MQIQPTIAAAGAAGSVSQASSKDRSGGTGAADAAATLPTSTALEQVARSEESSADRDAEGAMYGKAAGQKKKSSDAHGHSDTAHASGLPVKEPDPPGQLDILG